MCVTFEEFFRRSLNWIGIEIRNFLHIFSTFGFAASSNIRQQEENIYFYIVGMVLELLHLYFCSKPQDTFEIDRRLRF